jgi:hypothetical protein
MVRLRFLHNHAASNRKAQAQLIQTQATAFPISLFAIP